MLNIVHQNNIKSVIPLGVLHVYDMNERVLERAVLLDSISINSTNLRTSAIEADAVNSSLLTRPALLAPALLEAEATDRGENMISFLNPSK
jgi:hypothetical protein